MHKTSYDCYGIHYDRARQLTSELLAFLLSSCVCKSCRSHFDETLVVQLIDCWPSEPALNLREKNYLHRLFGSLLDNNMGHKVVMENRAYVELSSKSMRLLKTSMDNDSVVQSFVASLKEQWDIQYQAYKAEQIQTNPNLN